MPYSAESTARPVRVKMEVCPDRTIVWMTDNVEETTVEDQTVYLYDELRFDLPEGREETAASIEANFEDWWLYGCEDHTEPTLEERVSLLEEIIMEE